MAPLAPLVTEEIWRGLTGGRSVHLTDWPTPAELVTVPGLGAGTLEPGAEVTGAEFTDAELVAAIDRVREIVSATLGLRKANGLRVRQPLRELRVAIPFPRLALPFTDLLAAEVNVKNVVVLSIDDAAASEFGVWTRLDVNARAVGPRLGKAVQGVIRADGAAEVPDAWPDEP